MNTNAIALAAPYVVLQERLTGFLDFVPRQRQAEDCVIMRYSFRLETVEICILFGGFRQIV